MIKTLIVEDEAFVALDLQNILMNLGHEVIDIITSGEDALSIVHERVPDLILVDVSLAGTLNGVELVQQIRQDYDMPVIFITAFSDSATIESMKQTEPFEYMLKPFNEHVLRVTVELSLHKAMVRKEQLASERLLATTLRSIGDAVITTDQRGHIHFLNPMAETLTGWDLVEAKGQPLGAVFHVINDQTREPAFDPVHAVLDTGLSSMLANNTLLISKDGTEYPIEDSAAPIMGEDETIHGVVLVFRDVTQRQQSELWLGQAQKLDSLGLLAGGIAHDFNNILGTIMINISALRRQAASLPNSLRLIERIQRASQQAGELTGQLLSYAGGNPLKIEILDLNEIIDSSLDLIGPNQPVELIVEKELWHQPLPILSERSQIQQVLLNLILNAYDAMKEGKNEATLTLRSSSQYLNVDALRRFLARSALAEGTYALLSIQDTGSGIESSILQQIFDPFFSSKPTGSGLGLAATLGIIYQCDGGISVKSQVGVGTTFRVIFPCQADSIDVGHRRVDSAKSDNSADVDSAKSDKIADSRYPNAAPSDLDNDKGLILIADDQVDILDALNDILVVEGYETILASDGAEALELYKQYAQKITIVLMDIRMPLMNGTEALIAMNEYSPDFKAILMTGYADAATLSSYRHSLTDIPVISKPFSYEEIIEKIQELLKPKMS